MDDKCTLYVLIESYRWNSEEKKKYASANQSKTKKYIHLGSE
jgi:hypothetical protein